jgi:hypothetical protein
MKTTDSQIHTMQKNGPLTQAIEIIASRIIRAADATPFHLQQREMPEWQGAGVKIRSSETPVGSPTAIQHNDQPTLLTRHAFALTWLLLELRDAFGEKIDFSNKYEFYGELEEVARRHLSTYQPEPSDPRPLLFSVFAEALRWRNFDENVLAICEDAHAQLLSDFHDGSPCARRSDSPFFGRN